MRKRTAKLGAKWVKHGVKSLAAVPLHGVAPHQGLAVMAEAWSALLASSGIAHCPDLPAALACLRAMPHEWRHAGHCALSVPAWLEQHGLKSAAAWARRSGLHGSFALAWLCLAPAGGARPKEKAPRGEEGRGGKDSRKATGPAEEPPPE